ncbi:glycosyltransferase family 22 protein [Panaeolus papilionaceus]|nr:glycosyltransferase family 22 protein [Panaeolus papilionaceus]
MQPSTVRSLILRVLVAVFTRTYFQPDEYFQALEPAYHAVFGYGHLTWEWQTANPIRSILYPAVNIPVYWLLKQFGIFGESYVAHWLLIYLPRVLHGCLAALTDVWIGELARSVLGVGYSSTAQFLSLSCFFNFLALSRSLSNSLETSLSTVAFAFYPWDASVKLAPQLLHRSKLRKMIIFSALAMAVRPTNAVIWLFLYGNLLWSVRLHHRVILNIVKDILYVGMAFLSTLVLLDSIYYKKIVITPLNFLKTNLSSVSIFYGSNVWHYYLSQALPILLTTALPFTLHGIWRTMNSKSARNVPETTMLHLITWTIAIYSLAGHKEWRFIHPLLPLLHVFAAKSLVDIIPAQRLSLPDIPAKHIYLLLATLPISLYIVLFYCNGPISLISFIHSIPETGNSTVGIIMPCHSLPWQAYIHRPDLNNNNGMWSLGCEPPLQYVIPLEDYKDQTTVFFDSPADYLYRYFPNQVNTSFPASPYAASIAGEPAPIPRDDKQVYPWKHEWPRYLVFFGDLLRQANVQNILGGKGYREVWTAGRSWEGEGSRTGGVRVWKWQGSPSL